MTPPGASHQNIGNTEAIRNETYAKAALHVLKEYGDRSKQVEVLGVQA